MSRQQLINIFRPSQVLRLQLNGYHVTPQFRQQTLIFAVLIVFVMAVGTLGVCLFEPHLDLVSAFSSVAATLFNVGPGLAAVGPMTNFSALSAPTHLLLALMMALGRLELFAILVLFIPELWKKY